ncbi:MAG: rod shape-determining protein MreD [bacterium]|nr:rod shape-determining protein MreD [bacterium]
MRWLGFAVCAVIVLVLDTTVAPRLELRGVRPEWMLVLAVFFALHARSSDALIGAWLLGAAVDVMSVERFGLLSGSYALAALAVYAVRESVFRNNPLTHFAITFAASVIVRAVGAVYAGTVLAGTQAPLGAWQVTVGVICGAAYTAAWAPLVHHLLLRYPPLLGVLPPRRTSRRRRAGGGKRV